MQKYAKRICNKTCNHFQKLAIYENMQKCAIFANKKKKKTMQNLKVCKNIEKNMQDLETHQYSRIMI